LRQQAFGEVEPLLHLAHLLPQPADLGFEGFEPAHLGFKRFRPSLALAPAETRPQAAGP